MKTHDEYLEAMRNEPDPNRRAQIDAERLRAHEREIREAKRMEDAIRLQQFVEPGQIISLEAGEYEGLESMCHMRALVRFGFADMALRAREAGVSKCSDLPAWLVENGVAELLPNDYVFPWWVGADPEYGISMPDGHGRDWY